MSSASFSAISTQFSIYAGLSICIFGIIGNLINIRLLFPSRLNACSFLLFVSSFANIIALAEGLFPRILVIGFGIDPSSTSIIWCKSRYFIVNTAAIVSQTCLCFATIDRFFVSCRSITWRNRSKLRIAKISILIAIIVIIACNVPFLIFYTIIEVKTGAGDTTTVCSLINPGVIFYISYIFRPILLSTLPGTIMSIFGWLTYRNITSITGVQLRGTFQRSLTSMILLQIITITIPIIPFATINIYQVVTSSIVKTSYRLAQEALVYNITNIILFIGCASNFYVYIISASSYRRDLLRLGLFCYRIDHWNNRIGGMPREQLEMNTASLAKQLPQLVN